MRHVRITFDQNTPISIEHSMVEYGRMEVIGLTPEERTEYDDLEKEFGDGQKMEFTKAADLADPKKKAEILRHRRFAELDKKLTEHQMVWMQTDEESMPSSILLLMRVGVLPLYIENMPEEMVKKLMSPQIIIENPQILMGAQQTNIAQTPPAAAPAAQPTQTPQSQPMTSQQINALPPMDRVKAVINGISGNSIAGKAWVNLVSFDTKNPAEGIFPDAVTKANRIYIIPVDYLGQDWRPINNALIGAFSEAKAIWNGKQYRENSHWEVVFE